MRRPGDILRRWKRAFLEFRRKPQDSNENWDFETSAIDSQIVALSTIDSGKQPTLRQKLRWSLFGYCPFHRCRLKKDTGFRYCLQCEKESLTDYFPVPFEAERAESTGQSYIRAYLPKDGVLIVFGQFIVYGGELLMRRKKDCGGMLDGLLVRQKGITFFHQELDRALLLHNVVVEWRETSMQPNEYFVFDANERTLEVLWAETNRLFADIDM